MKGRPKDILVGLRFGHLRVTELAHTRRQGSFWQCACDCGKTTIVRQSNLRRGTSKSCGCARAEYVSASRIKHGALAGYKTTSEYHSWASAKARCFNASHAYYPRYGGRGISMCEEWRNDFAVFLQDMGVKPNGTSLDRIDNNGNYEPDNCRWATQSQQCRNKVNNRLFNFKGKSLCVVVIAERLGIPYKRLAWRLRAGWPLDTAFQQKKFPRRAVEQKENL